MSPHRALAPFALLALAALAGPAQAGPRDPLLVWTDAAGVVRYTTHTQRIPAGRREAAQVVTTRVTEREGAGIGDAIADLEGAGLEDAIADLERRIAEDESALAAYLSEEAEAGDRQALESVAERLPRLQEQLRALRARRGTVRPAAAPSAEDALPAAPRPADAP